MIQVTSRSGATEVQSTAEIHDLLLPYIGRTLRFKRAYSRNLHFPRGNGSSFTATAGGLGMVSRSGILKTLVLKSNHSSSMDHSENDELEVRLDGLPDSFSIGENFVRQIQLFQADLNRWTVIHQSPDWVSTVEKHGVSE